MHVVTETDPASGAILARNVYSPEFGDRVAFVNCSETNRTLHRRSHRVSGPQRQAGQSRRPCGACDSRVASAPDTIRVPPFKRRSRSPMGKSGSSPSRSAPRAARRRPELWRSGFAASTAPIGRSKASGITGAGRWASSIWKRPIASVNFLANGWLVYQTLACRMWARIGFLSIGRRVRLPRSAAGRDGPGACRAAVAPRASAACRCASVSRRGRAALVASAGGTRCADAFLRRLPVAAVGHLPLCRHDRRYRRAGRAHPFL